VIIFILPRFSAGGAERVVINILTGLHNSGYLVGIIAFDTKGPLLSIIPPDIPVYNLDTITLNRSIVSLVWKIWKLKPDVIFSTFGYINVAIILLRGLLPNKTKIWAREANLPSISLKNNKYPKLMPFLYRISYKHADKIICTSKIMKREFVSYFLVPADRIEILPNPINVNLIQSSVKKTKRFDIGGVCFVASGRMCFQKGFDRLLKWFSKLDNNTATIVILGDGDKKFELIEQSNRLNLKNRVKFVGYCKNPWQWYAGADCFLLSSRWEGMPNSVLESLVCGTPVIGTEESGGIADIANEVKNCNMITVVNSKKFVKAMEKVRIKDKDLKLKSYLPEIYKQENTVNIIKGWINEFK